MISKKKRNYYFLVSLLISFVLIIALANIALAYSFGDIQGFYQKTGGEAGLSQREATPIVAGVINQILTVVGAIFVILFIYAGVSWMISGGNDEKIGKAKKTMTYAVIGIFIIMGAYSITYFITLAIEQAGTAEQGGPGAANDACNASGGSCTAAECLTDPDTQIITCISTSCPARNNTTRNTSTDSQCSSSQVCCPGTTPPPSEQQSCSSCGQGALNTCDATECKGIRPSSPCIFCPGFIGGNCYENTGDCQEQCSNPDTCY